MSHLVEGKIKITNLNVLKKTCKDLGLEFKENCNVLRGYVNDSCDHAIEVPGAKYNIGVRKEKDGSYSLVYDNWAPGGLTQVLGEDLRKLTQKYSENLVRDSLKGWSITKQNLPDGTIVLRCIRA